MRDLAPVPPGLSALPLVAVRPSPLVDVPGLASDVERRFLVLDGYCRAVGDVEFDRLYAAVAESVDALADAPAHDFAGMLAKARALTECPAIEEDTVRSERIGTSLALDVLRMLAAPS